MKYFELHPIIEYDFNENNVLYDMVDIFRYNTIELDDVLKIDYVLEEGNDLHNISTTYFDSAENHWILNITNSIDSVEKIPELLEEKIINLFNKNKRKKSYFFIQKLNLAPGNFLIKTEDFTGFTITGGDPYAIVTEYDSILRKATIIEPSGSTLFQGDSVLILRKNEQQTNFEIVDPPGIQGISLDKNIPYVNSVLQFEKNNIWENPYKNVSGTGITYFSTNSEGTTFSKTLLFSYITNGISHASFNIVTEIDKVKKADNVLLKIPKVSTSLISNGMKEAFSIQNSSRVWTVNLIRSRLELS